MEADEMRVARDYLQGLRNLRAQGYADAEEQRADRSGSLPGSAERLGSYDDRGKLLTG
jgi:hypothetical protein